MTAAETDHGRRRRVRALVDAASRAEDWAVAARLLARAAHIALEAADAEDRHEREQAERPGAA